MVEPVHSVEEERFAEAAVNGRQEATDTDDEGSEGYKKGGAVVSRCDLCMKAFYFGYDLAAVALQIISRG